MKPIFIIIPALLGPFGAMAQSETTDSIKTQNLDEVVVEAQLQRTNAQKSTYIPTTKQKNASQTGADLIDQMGIPQLKVLMGNSVETNSGKPVALFIGERLEGNAYVRCQEGGIL